MKFHYAITLLALITLGCQTPSKKTELPTQEETNNEQSSKITLVDLDNEPMSAEKGNVLILNIWATWCKPCIEEMPALAEMAKQLPETHELILASDEDLKRINAFVAARSLDLRFARLTSNVEALGVFSLPTTLIINSKGEILDTLVGARDWNAPETIEYLKTFEP